MYLRVKTRKSVKDIFEAVESSQSVRLSDQYLVMFQTERSQTAAQRRDVQLRLSWLRQVLHDAKRSQETRPHAHA